MGEENTDLVDLDLNLGPNGNSNDTGETGSGCYSNGSLYLRYLSDRHRYNRLRLDHHGCLLAWRRGPGLYETGNATATGLTSRDATLIGPNSVMSESRTIEISKNRENRYAFSTNETQDKKADGYIHNNESAFFDCNICLDLAKEPIVTCCGHLFCWPCIYRWVDHHSSANECPVCKGKVTVKNIVPIYGRGPNTPESDADSSMKIPPRPQAQRAERSSQLIQRVRGVENSFDFAHFQNYSTTTSITGPTSSSLSAESEFFIGSYSHINHMESIREVALTFEDSGSMSNNGVIHYSDQTLDNSADSFSARSSRRRNGTSRDSDASTVDLPRTRRRLS